MMHVEQLHWRDDDFTESFLYTTKMQMHSTRDTHTLH